MTSDLCSASALLPVCRLPATDKVSWQPALHSRVGIQEAAIVPHEWNNRTRRERKIWEVKKLEWKEGRKPSKGCERAFVSQMVKDGDHPHDGGFTVLSAVTFKDETFPHCVRAVNAVHTSICDERAYFRLIAALFTTDFSIALACRLTCLCSIMWFGPIFQPLRAGSRDAQPFTARR